VDHLVLGAVPEPFYAVSPCYQRFPQCTDHEVCNLLQASRDDAAA
jgi:predicted phosphoribosyltransferase